MTNTPNPQAMIEKIKAILDKYCFGNPVTDPIEYSAKACDEIQALITEARIEQIMQDELSLMDTELPEEEIIQWRLDRLTQLKKGLSNE